MITLFLPTLWAQDVTIQNDTAYNNTFGLGDMVGWFAYPECAISVLTPDPADLPLDLHTIMLYFGSQAGTLDGQTTS